MPRTPAKETLNQIGQKVTLKGWVRLFRDHGKVAFADIRDYSGVIQVVFVSSMLDEKSAGVVKGLGGEDVVEIIGTVQSRKEGTENPDMETGTVEILADSIKVLQKAEELPFDMGAKELNLELPTLLDHRSLTLRHPKVQAIFKTQEIIINAFRKALKEKGFTEFTAPAIVPTATEGGAEVFKVQYFDKDAFLAQSPQFYKQIMVGVYERVFTVGKAYRAEPSVTTRHLTEYITLDAEFGFIDDFSEVMDMSEYMVRYIFERLKEEGSDHLNMYEVSIPEIQGSIPRVRLKEAQEIIFERTGRDLRKEPDLDPQGERDICEWAKEKHGSELVFITHYPTSKRPFYTYPDPEDLEHTHSFDLIGRGVEWITGGRRVNDHKQLVENIKKWGNNPKDFEIYLQAFKYGMPPEGGFALGAERITMNVLGLKNVREASSFPRDMERVDLRLADN
jgi:nondiscriminating aspartyl-tRNA synthetase